MTSPDRQPPRVTIENCVFAKRCTQRWAELEPVDASGNVRHCGDCSRHVHFCRTDEELGREVRLGHCVAFRRGGPPGPERNPESRARTLVGMVASPYQG